MTDPKSHLTGPVFTIGHSIRSIGGFLELLKIHAIESLVDVRSFPGSRRHPQFNQSPLAKTLLQAGVSYRHMVTLGGKRKGQEGEKADLHKRNRPFASYIDYAKTPEFRSALSELEILARAQRVAIMCAEANWTQCHRSIITQELIKDGFTVTHIMDAAQDRTAASSPRLPGF